MGDDDGYDDSGYDEYSGSSDDGGGQPSYLDASLDDSLSGFDAAQGQGPVPQEAIDAADAPSPRAQADYDFIAGGDGSLDDARRTALTLGLDDPSEVDDYLKR